jgi:hypothetical protein
LAATGPRACGCYWRYRDICVELLAARPCPHAAPADVGRSDVERDPAGCVRSRSDASGPHRFGRADGYAAADGQATADGQGPADSQGPAHGDRSRGHARTSAWQRLRARRRSHHSAWGPADLPAAGQATVHGLCSQHRRPDMYLRRRPGITQAGRQVRPGTRMEPGGLRAPLQFAHCPADARRAIHEAYFVESHTFRSGLPGSWAGRAARDLHGHRHLRHRAQSDRRVLPALAGLAVRSRSASPQSQPGGSARCGAGSQQKRDVRGTTRAGPGNYGAG